MGAISSVVNTKKGLLAPWSVIPFHFGVSMLKTIIYFNSLEQTITGALGDGRGGGGPFYMFLDSGDGVGDGYDHRWKHTGASMVASAVRSINNKETGDGVGNHVGNGVGWPIPSSGCDT